VAKIDELAKNEFPDLIKAAAAGTLL